MPDRFVTIGHITEDTADPVNIIGGSVAYGGYAAKAQGFNVHIITKIPSQHRFIKQLASDDINVHLIPTKKTGVTTFTNRYDANGKRQQILSGQQENISISDLSEIQKHIDDALYVVVAPIIGEVDMQLLPQLAKKSKVVVLPQGYFRQVGKNGIIHQKAWENFTQYLDSAFITVLSDEDITIEGVFHEQLLNQIIRLSEVVVLTRGELGSSLYQSGRKILDNMAFPLEREQITSYTGAGDAFAIAYLAKYNKTGDHTFANIYANLYAGIKLVGISGQGIDSIPTQEQLKNFVDTHPDQTSIFLKVIMQIPPYSVYDIANYKSP